MQFQQIYTSFLEFGSLLFSLFFCFKFDFFLQGEGGGRDIYMYSRGVQQIPKDAHLFFGQKPGPCQNQAVY